MTPKRPARNELPTPGPLDTVGRRVAQARRELAVALRRDVTAKDLAVWAGVPPSTVTRLEADLVEPRDATVRSLASVLGRVGWDEARLRYGIVTLPGRPDPAAPGVPGAVPHIGRAIMDTVDAERPARNITPGASPAVPDGASRPAGKRRAR